MIDLSAALFGLLSVGAAEAQLPAKDSCAAGQSCLVLTPADMFESAERLAIEGQTDAAEAVLDSLAKNRDADVRAEAKFRLGNLKANTGDLDGAATAYRRLLDEKPGATRVRLELARVLALLGEDDAARSQLRRASSAGLPEDVARVVDQFQLSLRSRRRYGVGLEVGLAPDSNINRATNSSTVTIGSTPIDLSPDAQAQSGLGLAIGSQAFWRPAIGPNTKMLLTVSGKADLYRLSQFNDVSLSIAVGPELIRGRSTVRPSGLVGRRWFGGNLYSENYGATVNVRHQLNRVSQVQVDLTALQTDTRINPALTGRATSVAVRYERALSPRLFGRLTTRIDRQGARDPAFATWSSGGELLVSRDVGRLSVYGRAGYYRTWGDASFSLPPARRRDDLVDLEAGLVLRNLSVLGLAPVVRLRRTENHSPVFFYDFRRTRFEFGVTREF